MNEDFWLCIKKVKNHNASWKWPTLIWQYYQPNSILKFVCAINVVVSLWWKYPTSINSLYCKMNKLLRTELLFMWSEPLKVNNYILSSCKTLQVKKIEFVLTWIHFHNSPSWIAVDSISFSIFFVKKNGVLLYDTLIVALSMWWFDESKYQLIPFFVIQLSYEKLSTISLL